MSKRNKTHAYHAVVADRRQRRSDEELENSTPLTAEEFHRQRREQEAREREEIRRLREEANEQERIRRRPSVN